MTDSARLERARRALAAKRAQRPGAVPPLTTRPDDAEVLLSDSQLQLWTAHALDPTGAAYTVPAALDIAGPLDAAALTEAYDWLLARHEGLRLQVEEVRGKPRPRIAGNLPPMRRVDLTGLPEAEAGRRCAELSEEELRAPFDLSAGAPLVRGLLLALAPEQHRLVVVFQHLVIDGLSVSTVLRELVDAYGAIRSGEPLPPVPQGPSYTDFAWWEQRRKAERAGREDPSLAYWKRLLEGAPRGLPLPLDHARPDTRAHHGDHLIRATGTSLRSRAEKFAADNGVSVVSVLYGAWRAVLHRAALTDDLVIGMPVANRMRTELRGIVGPFLNTLPLRSRLRETASLRDLTLESARTVADSLEHQHVPTSTISGALPEDASGTPLYGATFTYLGEDRSDLWLGEARVTPVHAETGTAKSEVTLSVASRGESFELALEYDTEILRRSTAGGLLEAYLRLLDAGLEDPDRAVRLLPTGPRAEVPAGPREAEALRAGPREAETGTAGPRGAETGTALDAAFLRSVERFPERTAVQWRGRQVTYRELSARVDALARHLVTRGVRPGDRVPLLLERGPARVVAVLAVLRAGAAYVPVDPGHPAERVRHILDDSGGRLLVADGGSAAAGHGGIARVGVDAEGAPLGDTSGDAGVVLPARHPGDMAYSIYTSGSTGRPKGVAISDAQLVRLFSATDEHFDFSHEDVWSGFFSYSFDFAVWELWGALMYGGSLVLVPEETTTSPADLLELLERHRVTVLSQTPSAFKGLAAADTAAGSAHELALRYVVFGGEALEVNTLRPWLEARGESAPRLVNMYGITETTVHVTHRVVTAADLGDRPGSPIGRPLSDLSLHVLDDGLNPLPAGMAGELYVGGAGLGAGYTGRGGLTAGRFIPDPFSGVPGARLYRTGDLARVSEDGEIEYLGRSDAQVQVRGFRIELGEVESALLAHPDIAAVVADVRDAQLVAHLVPAAGELPGVHELREHAAGLLPPYMVPAVFVPLERVPLTVNGKVDRRALPDPAESRLAAGTTFVPPRTPLERTVAGIWCEALGVTGIGVHDNFFSLGGDSIRAVEVTGRLRAIGYETRVHSLFRHQTVAEFTAELGDADAAPLTSATAEPFEMIRAEDRDALPEDAEDAYPLTATQAGMLYHLHLQPEAGIYHNTVSVRMRGRLDGEALRRALTDTVARHPILRTSICMDGYSEPLQIVHRSAVPRLTVTDISGRTEAEQLAAIDEFVEDERREHLDLSTAPLYRLAVHLLGGGEFQLTISENHVILDGWSWTSTIAEIFGRQAALLDGDPGYDGRWPEVAARYADFVKLERSVAGNPQAAESWRERLADAEPRSVADLRTSGMPDVRRHAVDIDTATSQRLAAMAAEAGLPLKSLAVAAHMKVLAEALAVDNPVTGMVLHGRPDRPGAEDIRGLFVNMLPASVAVPGGTWRELALRTFEEERTLLEHRHTPLISVQEAMGNDPLFDVGVNFVRFHALGAVLDTGVVELVGHHPASAEDTNYAVMATFSVHPPAKELALMLAYDADRVSAERVEDLAAMYAEALRRFADEPDSPHDGRRLLPQDEQTVRDRAFGGTLAVPGGTLHGTVAATARARSGAVAVTGPDGELSYGELADRARKSAAALAANGVRRGDLVAVVARRGTGLAVGVLAAMAAGAAYVPVDPELPLERIAHLIRDSGCATALTAHLTEDDAPLLGLLAAEGVTVLAVTDAVAGVHGAREPDQADGDDLAYVIYTSGSTGAPKGVAVTHRNVLSYLRASATVVEPGTTDIVAVRSTFTFDLSVWELFAGLVAGARIDFVPGEVASDAQELHRHLRTRRVSMLATTPTIAQELAAVDSGSGPAMGLRALLLAGEEVVPGRIADWFDGPSASGCTVLNWYGPTEATVLMTVAELTADVTRRQRAPIGRPVPGSSVWVLDEDLRPVPPGTAGELCIGGLQVAEGYWRRPGLTASQFVPDPFSAVPGSRLYRTGDRAVHRSDGQLEFLGRFDNQIKLRGHRIELGEIESVLLEDPSVADCTVVVHGRGGPTPQLVAYVVASGHGGTGLDRREMRSRAASRLPRHALPAAIREISEIPHTPSGKLDRRSLPVPTAEDFLGTAGGSEPARDETERRLLGVWQELLGLEGLGIRDHFYEAGGHSLLATRLLLRIRREFGVRVRIQQAMADFTVAGLADVIRSAAQEAAQAAAQAAAPKEAADAGPPQSGAARPAALEKTDDR